MYTHVLQGSFSVIVEAWHDNTRDGPSQGTITPFWAPFAVCTCSAPFFVQISVVSVLYTRSILVIFSHGTLNA